MNICRIMIPIVLTAVCNIPRVSGQQNSPSDATRPMVLTEAIPLEGVKGRFDHFGTSGKLLFVSALGNNTVEVIGISSRTLEHTITGVSNPQGVVYAPEVNKLFVASSQGTLYIYEGSKFDLVTSIDFHGDVDNLRYDPVTKCVYVGYGDDEAAAIGTVDATNNQRLEEEYKLGAHPESFQLEKSGSRIFRNHKWELPINGTICRAAFRNCASMATGGCTLCRGSCSDFLARQAKELQSFTDKADTGTTKRSEGGQSLSESSSRSTDCSPMPSLWITG